MSTQKAEAQLRSRLSRVVRYELGGQCTPVETAGTAGRGVLDVELCLPGWPRAVQAWLELKVHDVSNPARAKKIGHFRREQAKWMRDRVALGGEARAGLLVMARLGPAKREHVVLRGEDAARLWIDQQRGGFSWNEIRELSCVLPSPALRADWLRAAVELL